jgi:hypothetical protein
MSTSEMVSTDEAAAILGLSPKTLRGWRWLGRGPKYFKYGRVRSSAVRYHRDELARFKASNEFSGTFEYMQSIKLF